MGRYHQNACFVNISRKHQFHCFVFESRSVPWFSVWMNRCHQNAHLHVAYLSRAQNMAHKAGGYIYIYTRCQLFYKTTFYPLFFRIHPCNWEENKKKEASLRTKIYKIALEWTKVKPDSDIG